MPFSFLRLPVSKLCTNTGEVGSVRPLRFSTWTSAVSMSSPCSAK